MPSASWNDYEIIHEGAAAEREAYAGRHRRGLMRQGELFAEYRSAISGFGPGTGLRVRPGNQQGLGSRRQMFGDYLERVHVLIHRHFVETYLASNPQAGGQGVLSLQTVLELAIKSDGTLEHAKFVKTSGNAVYDFEAFRAVKQITIPPPPPELQSYDGLTYIHWGFDRDEDACGVPNARPFILRPE